MSTLLDLIQTKVNYVVQEAIVVIKDIFRKYPNKYVPVPPGEADASLLGTGLVGGKSKASPLFLTSLPQTAFSEETLGFFLISPEQSLLCSSDQNKNSNVTDKTQIPLLTALMGS